MTDDTPLVTQMELDAWANYHPIEVFRVMPEMQLTVELRHAFISGHRAASQSSAERIASLEARVAGLEALVEALRDAPNIEAVMRRAAFSSTEHLYELSPSQKDKGRE
jgi:hypothetical protein